MIMTRLSGRKMLLALIRLLAEIHWLFGGWKRWLGIWEGVEVRPRAPCSELTPDLEAVESPALLSKAGDSGFALARSLGVVVRPRSSSWERSAGLEPWAGNWCRLWEAFPWQRPPG